MLGAILKIGGAAVKGAINIARKRRAEKKAKKAEKKISEAESLLASKLSLDRADKGGGIGGGGSVDSAVESKFVALLGNREKKVPKWIFAAAAAAVVVLVMFLFKRKRR